MGKLINGHSVKRKHHNSCSSCSYTYRFYDENQALSLIETGKEAGVAEAYLLDNRLFSAHLWGVFQHSTRREKPHAGNTSAAH
jgi:hypothetical protein